MTFRQEKLKGDERIPAARSYIAEHGLNELIAGQARRPRHHRAGRPVQLADARAAAAGPGRRLRRERDPAAGAQRHLPAGARAGRGLLRRQARACWWSRKASPSTSSRRSRTLLRRRDIQTPAARQGPAAGGGRVHRRGARRRGCSQFAAHATLPGARSTRRRHAHWLAGNRARREAVAAQLDEPLPARPPQLLHRLPRAAGVLGAQAGAAGRRAGAHRRPTSAATPSPPSSRSRWAIRSWATA